MDGVAELDTCRAEMGTSQMYWALGEARGRGLNGNKDMERVQAGANGMSSRHQRACSLVARVWAWI